MKRRWAEVTSATVTTGGESLIYMYGQPEGSYSNKRSPGRTETERREKEEKDVRGWRRGREVTDEGHMQRSRARRTQGRKEQAKQCQLSLMHLLETLIFFSHSLYVSDGGRSQATLARHQSATGVAEGRERRDGATIKTGVGMVTTLRGGTVSPINEARLHKSFTALFS